MPHVRFTIVLYFRGVSDGKVVAILKNSKPHCRGALGFGSRSTVRGNVPKSRVTKSGNASKKGDKRQETRRTKRYLLTSFANLGFIGST